MGRIVPTRYGSVTQLSASVARDNRDRPREIEMGKPSHTEQLASWITTVRQKKLMCHRSPKRDFRVEAVLTHALHKAEYELRAKQLSRIARWRRLRKHLLKGVEYGSCGRYNATERECEMNGQCSNLRDTNFWRQNLPDDLYEDLSSMVDFLQQLSEVKSSVHR
ncbi:uncharacterized protein LOC112464163 [Temnothorax curvispinosus]|uniref:Uncharacterized protein LOC112454726 n=2 Tax=Temnothorax TaxID=300110 RepID=A0A6J1R0Z9_9HYME|nr:uncharacterized protein LOC112454726 [Temnothorax curvispinosus]XP_024886771.1 uncharacterized protein LOC112464163 [Temnothorax curvispinosus]TGZ50258.1 Uncharacterized protein DBV15_02066 [Temnothorax longispinosus]